MPLRDAEDLHDRLLTECASRGLEPDDSATSKTETALRDLLPIRR